MGNVIELRPRAAASGGDTKMVLAGMMAQEGTGELQGSVHIAATRNGTEIHILGTCADRLQVGVLALVKGLNFVCDKIAASGTSGHTDGSGPITLNLPHRRLPRRLRESTNFGELE